MNINRESIGNLHDKIGIQLLPEDYMPGVEKQLKKLKNQAIVPGFRKGFVPRHMIERMYGESVLIETINDIVNTNMTNYLSENNIDIFWEPVIVEKSTLLEKNQPYEFTFEIGIRPAVSIDYESLKSIVYHKIIASDYDIDAKLNLLRKQKGTFSSEETIADEDMLMVSVTSADETVQTFTSSILMNYIKQECKDLFVGKNVGTELDIDTTAIFKGSNERATFLNTHPEKLDHAPVNVHVKIDAIYHMKPAELNEEFFQQLSQENEILNEQTLRDKIAQQIAADYRLESYYFYSDHIMKELSEKTPLELPVEFLKKYLVQSKDQQAITQENIEEQYPVIETYIRRQLIEGQLLNDFQIQVKSEDVRNLLTSIVSQRYFGQSRPSNEEDAKVVSGIVDNMLKEGTSKEITTAYDLVQNEQVVQCLLDKLNPPVREITANEFSQLIRDLRAKVDKQTEEKQELSQLEKASDKAETSMENTEQSNQHIEEQSENK
jgi:trigger factor